jgi:hypothetical protein
MVQTLIVYAIVTAAAGWTGWSLFLRGWVKRRAAAKRGGCGSSDCACGD